MVSLFGKNSNETLDCTVASKISLDSPGKRQNASAWGSCTKTPKGNGKIMTQKWLTACQNGFLKKFRTIKSLYLKKLTTNNLQQK